MPPDNLLQTLLQHEGIERPAAGDRHGLVVDRNLTSQMAMHPNLLLRKGKRYAHVRGPTGDRRRRFRSLINLLPQALFEQSLFRLGKEIIFGDFLALTHIRFGRKSKMGMHGRAAAASRIASKSFSIFSMAAKEKMSGLYWMRRMIPLGRWLNSRYK